MKRQLPTIPAALSLLLCGLTLCVGCHSRGTTRQRTESMATLREAGVDTPQLEAFVTARTGVLQAGDRFMTLYRDDAGRLVAVADPQAEQEDRHYAWTMLGEVTDGTVTLITSDGYALTAAHCVDDGDVIVAYLSRQGADGKKGLVAKVRKVWVGKPKGVASDLALLKLDAPGDAPADLYCFSWAGDNQITPGAPVVLAGHQSAEPGSALTLAAGVLRDRPRTSRIGEANADLIAFDAPSQRGDSGGPLTTTSGALVGIVVGYYAPLFGSGYGVAVRPDARWVEELIRKDRTRFPQDGQADSSAAESEMR